MTDPLKSLAWDDLRLVKEIAAAKGLAGAAERLGVNHSTVFRRLGQLEAAIGLALFERHRTGYALTTTGEAMVALAQRVDADITDFTRKLAGQAFAPAGELRVTTSDTLLLHLLMPMFARFRDRCPDLRLDLVVGNQALNLSQRDADVAIRATDHPPETLVGRRAARIAWALYGRATDFPQPGPVEPQSLDQRPWVALGDNFATMQVARFARANVAPERLASRSIRCWAWPKRSRPASASAICPASSRTLVPRSSAWPHRTPHSPATSGCSPIPTCATRPACGCSWISSPPRSPASRAFIEGEPGAVRPTA